LTPKTIALLFAADRNEHVFGSGGIAERCSRGELVVSDRYLPSSLVYQGITCGDEFPELLNQDFPGPELLIYLDIDPETAQKRMAGREKKEIFEYIEFQIMASQRYKALLPRLSEEGVRVEIIDASFSLEEVAKEVWDAIEEMPIMKK
jgi:dTMP kinase